MRSAGCIINDLWDRHLDKSVKRTQARPLASGQLSIKNAISALIFLLLLALLIFMTFPFRAQIVCLLSLSMASIYPSMKRIFAVPQAFFGLTFNMGVLIAAAIYNAWTLKTHFLYLSLVLWSIGYDTIYALQDKEDDQKAGIQSSALFFGQYIVIYLVLIYVLSLLFWFFIIKSGSLWSLLTLVGAVCFAIYMVIDLAKKAPPYNDKWFKLNQWYGWMMLVSLIFYRTF